MAVAVGKGMVKLEKSLASSYSAAGLKQVCLENSNQIMDFELGRIFTLKFENSTSWLKLGFVRVITTNLTGCQNLALMMADSLVRYF